MEPFVLENDCYFTIEPWTKEANDLVAGFSTRLGGVSREPFSSLNVGFHVHDEDKHVCENRKILAKAIDIPIQNWVGAKQTHETNIIKLHKSDCGKGAMDYESSFDKTDGFFTKEKGILLTLCYADCVPIYFYAKNEGAIGIVHGGWRGSVHNIVGKMVQLFNEEGIESKNIQVAIGPSICKQCYIVDDRVINFVEKSLEQNNEKPYNLISEGQYELDLKLLNKQLLLQSGIRQENIFMTNFCTSCEDDTFFSHRKHHGNTGRMIGFIGWKEE